MTKNEKRELFEEVAWMDAAGIFILFFAGILFFFKQERNKGIEVMDSYRFTS